GVREHPGTDSGSGATQQKVTPQHGEQQVPGEQYPFCACLRRARPENRGRKLARERARGRPVESQTSATLLARLRQVPADQAAWAQFTQRYGRKIYAWCRRWNLQEADAEDLTQNVLLKLAEKMQTFVYDPEKSFRAWLK